MIVAVSVSCTALVIVLIVAVALTRLRNSRLVQLRDANQFSNPSFGVDLDDKTVNISFDEPMLFSDA